jgi:hypothetical protein
MSDPLKQQLRGALGDKWKVFHFFLFFFLFMSDALKQQLREGSEQLLRGARSFKLN